MSTATLIFFAIALISLLNKKQATVQLLLLVKIKLFTFKSLPKIMGKGYHKRTCTNSKIFCFWGNALESGYVFVIAILVHMMFMFLILQLLKEQYENQISTFCPMKIICFCVELYILYCKNIQNYAIIVSLIVIVCQGFL